MSSFTSIHIDLRAYSCSPDSSDRRAISANERTPSPPNAKVFFLGLEEGARIAPNGHTVRRKWDRNNPRRRSRPNSGHHHLLVDTALPRLDQEIPSDFNNLHFGRGQTETELSLSLGEHTLQLLLGDHRHVPHDPPVMSKVIHVFVEDSAVIHKPTPSQLGDNLPPERGFIS